MILIWGYKTCTSTLSSHETQRLLETTALPVCPMRNCQGRVRAMNVQRYCHMYWIPCCQAGPSKVIVKCTTCNSMFSIADYKRFQQLLQQQQRGGSSSSISGGDKLHALISAGHYEVTEIMCREILKRNPLDMNAMIYLNVALNGVGKAEESNRITEQIIFHWQTYMRSEWIAKGCPKENSAFTRLIYNHGITKNYSIEAKQFFQNEIVDAQRVALYKILILPRATGGAGAGAESKRLFKLLKPAMKLEAKSSANDSYYILVEVLASMDLKDIITYPRRDATNETITASNEDEENESPPDIRKVTADVVAYVMKGKQQQDSLLHDNIDDHSSKAVSPVLEKFNNVEEGHSPNRFVFASGTEMDQQKASRLKNAVSLANWRDIRDFFVSLSQDEQQQQQQPQVLCEQRSVWIGVVQEEIEKLWSAEAKVDIFAFMSPLLDSWLKAEPNNIDCRLIRLRTYTAWAWAARTGRLARDVTAERFAVFDKRLREAAKELTESKSIGSVDPLLYECAMPIIKGLNNKEDVLNGMTMEECLKGLKQTSHPLCFRAHIQALQFYCKKWHGSHEKMFDYVKSITTQLPDGHPLWVLVPMAHYERALIEPPKDYWQRHQVIMEVFGAYRKAFPTGGDIMDHQETATPVLLLPHQRMYKSICRNYFAYCLVMTQQYDEARRQFHIIGTRPNKSPWHTMNRYKYFAGMFGFDTEEGPLENDEINTIPIAEAAVISENDGANFVAAESVVVPEMMLQETTALTMAEAREIV